MANIEDTLVRYKEKLENHLLYDLEIPVFISPRFIRKNGSTGTITPKRLLQKKRGIAIIGEPGFGKSVAQIHLAKAVTKEKNSKSIPLFIRNDITDFSTDQKNTSNGGIIKHILDYVRDRFKGFLGADNASSVLKKLVQERRLIIFIDGIDEINIALMRKSGKGIVYYLEQIMMQIPGLSDCQFIVSCRKNRFEDCKLSMWNNWYELEPWSESKIMRYFKKHEEITKILENSEARNSLLDLFRVPLFCFLTYRLVKGPTNFLNEPVDGKKMIYLLPKETTYLYTRYLTKSIFKRVGVEDTEKLLDALSILAPKISESNCKDNEILEVFQDYFKINIQKAKEIYSKLVDLGIIYREDILAYVSFSHESYKEYFVAYHIFKLLKSFKERKNAFIRMSEMTEEGKRWLDGIGTVLPNIGTYSFLRHLSSGYIHTRLQFPREKGLNLSDILEILQVALNRYEIDLNGKKRLPDEIKNIFIVLLQLIRGYLYQEKNDSNIKSYISDLADSIKMTLGMCCKKKDIILRREAAATLAGIDLTELKKVIDHMIGDADSYDYHRTFISKVWGVVENDTEAIRNASKIAWEIILSDEGHRPKLRMLNIFSLAQFSNLQEDIHRLEKLKSNLEERGEPEHTDYQFLTRVIGESINRINERIKLGQK